MRSSLTNTLAKQIEQHDSPSAKDYQITDMFLSQDVNFYLCKNMHFLF